MQRRPRRTSPAADRACSRRSTSTCARVERDRGVERARVDRAPGSANVSVAGSNIGERARRRRSARRGRRAASPARRRRTRAVASASAGGTVDRRERRGRGIVVLGGRQRAAVAGRSPPTTSTPCAGARDERLRARRRSCAPTAAEPVERRHRDRDRRAVRRGRRTSSGAVLPAATDVAVAPSTSTPSCSVSAGKSRDLDRRSRRDRAPSSPSARTRSR